ncbi:MAG: hypothetical protein Q9210_000813 [Variospora velana]
MLRAVEPVTASTLLETLPYSAPSTCGVRSLAIFSPRKESEALSLPIAPGTRTLPMPFLDLTNSRSRCRARNLALMCSTAVIDVKNSVTSPPSTLGCTADNVATNDAQNVPTHAPKNVASHVAIARRQSWWTLYRVDMRSPSNVLMLIRRRRGNAPSAWSQRHYLVDTRSKRFAPRRMSLYFARHSANSFMSAVTRAEGNVISVRRTSSTANASVCVPSSCHAATSAQTSAITDHALHASNPASDPANMGKPVKSPVQMSAIHACKAASRHPVPTGAVRLSVPCHVAGSPAANLVSIFYLAHTSAPGFAVSDVPLCVCNVKRDKCLKEPRCFYYAATISTWHHWMLYLDLLICLN